MTPPSPPALILRPHGRLGNHILQWVTGQSLAARVPGLALSNYRLPEFGLVDQGLLRRHFFLPTIFNQDSDLDLIADLMRRGDMPLARLYCMVLQADAWGDPERFRRLLPTQPVPKEATAGPGEILLNVRADEILKARHKDYGPVPLGFYTAVLRETGLRPVFMGQLGQDHYSDLLRQSFPDARFLPSRGVMADFNALRQARHLALSISTFSWAAGWLSQAESLHLPVLGLFNPAQRPDIGLLPRGDARFHYYGFGIRRWTATPDQITALTDLTPAPLLTAAQLDALRGDADNARAKARAADAARLTAAAARSRPFLPLLRKLYLRK